MAGARSFEDLDAWKLSAELRDLIGVQIKAPHVARDFDFCDQIRDSARSAPRNIAEGFGAYQPREFARFTRIARRSLTETQNHLLEGRKIGHFPEPVARELLFLCKRALGATTALLRYLDGCDGRPPTSWPER